MARLWTSGFELRSASAGVEFDTVTGTAPTISTTTVRTTGGAAIRFNPAAAASYVTHRFAANAIRSQSVRIAFRFASFPAADVDIFQWYDGTNGFPSVRFIAASTALQCRNGTPANIGSASATLSLNTWYVLQMTYNDTTGDTVDAYLDGTQFCTAQVGGDVGGLGQMRFGLLTTSTADLFMDDIAVNDTTGTTDTGPPDRLARVAILHANAAGDNALWPTATGGTAGTANNFTRVAEVPPDDGTTHNGIAVTGTTQIDDFNVTDIATAGIASGDAVAHVGVGIRVGSTAVTATSLVARLKGTAAGTTTESASISAAISGWRTGGVVAAGSPQPSANILAYVNPQGGAAWTASALDSVQVGYRANVSQTTVRRVTKIWALVEYVPNPSVSATTTPATVVGLVAITGTVQAGSAPSPATVAGAAAVSGTVQLSVLAAPTTIAGTTAVAGTALASSAAAPGAIAPPAVVLSGTALTGSTAAPATIAPVKVVVSGTAQAGASPAPATIAPSAVTVSGTAQASAVATPATIAPVKVTVSGSAETASTATVPAGTIAPVKVVISGTALTGTTTSPATIAPVKAVVTAAAQSSRTAVAATVAGIAAIGGTAQAGTGTAPGAITPPPVAITGTGMAGAAPASLPINGATTVSGTPNTGSAPAPATIVPPSVLLSGSAQTASGAVVAPGTVAGTVVLTGSAAAGTGAAAETIAGSAAISGTARAGSAPRPTAIDGQVVIGPHAASGPIVVFTIAPARVVVSASVVLPGIPVGTVLGGVGIGPHLIYRTAVAATILGLARMNPVAILIVTYTPGDPVVTGDALTARVIGDPVGGAVTGTALAASVSSSTITAGVS